MGFEQMQSYFGFTRLPFDRRIAPSALYRSASHQEARARIQFLISQGALGLIWRTSRFLCKRCLVG